MPTATTTSIDSPSLPARSPLVSWLAVISVMLGIFSIITTEILPIGLLTSIGSSFTISDGMAGLMMTMPGFLAAVSAPVVTVATGRIDRRLMLGTFILLLALANFLAAVAPSYWLVLVSRVLVGVTIGGFWSIGAGLASRLVPAESVGRATAVIFSAVPLGSVLGVPLGTLIGDVAGWRTAFLVMGILTLCVFAMLLLVVPPLPTDEPTRLSALTGMLRSVNTRFALVMTFLVVLAHFGAYTYVTPFLEQVTHVSAGLITVYLLVYGVAGIAGNFLGGSAVARYPIGTFAAAALMIASTRLCCSRCSARRISAPWPCWFCGALPTVPCLSARRPGSPRPHPIHPKPLPCSSRLRSRPPFPSGRWSEVSWLTTPPHPWS